MKRSSTQHGHVMLLSLMAILVIAGFGLAAMNSTGASARFADRSRDLAALQSAADGAIEYAYGVWRKRTIQVDQALSTTELAALNVGTFSPGSGFSFASDTFGPLKIVPVDRYGMPVTSGTPPSITVDVKGHPGWRGRVYAYQASVRLTANSIGSKPLFAGVKRRFEYSGVPLFQAMWFFEHRLEVYKPADMIVGGLVHTNSDAWYSWEGSSDLTFTGQVSYVTDYRPAEVPPFGAAWSPPSGTLQPPIFGNGGKDAQLHKVTRMEPLGADPSTVVDPSPSNPNDDSMHELIETPVASSPDPSVISKRRLFNKAGIVISLNGDTTTVTAKNGATLTTAQRTAITGSKVDRKNVYDRREAANVNMTTFDMSKLSPALAAVPGFNGVVYFENTGTNEASGVRSAVRLKSGGVIAGDLTVATEGGAYIWGDYNTGATSATNAATVPTNNNGNPNNTEDPNLSNYTPKSTAVIADAVTVLSNAWNDTNASSGLTSRVASNTTVNTAIMAGFMPSGYQPSSGSQYGYSGGANNFVRFLESWNNKYMTYYGSMVELFASTKFIGEWDTGAIYAPPIRRWNYDSRFNTSPPPGSVEGMTYDRGSWERF